jgi:rhodanese-related sulfurtransferase
MVEEVSVQATWERLKADPTSQLIDVRTQAEFAFVGVKDLDAIGKQPILIEWQSFPDNKVHPDFAVRLSKALQEAGTPKTAELFFICRSGGRSLMAARAMEQEGWLRCINVIGGFEGNLDENRHRGKAAGWKAHGLPWVQG